MSFTQQEYEEMLARAKANANVQPPPAMPLYPQSRPGETITVREVKPRPPRCQWNKTEEAYSLLLEGQRRAGEILDWKYEAITLKLADGCRYTPDFAVWMPDGALHFHEVKGGFYRDDARAKFKAATALFPYFGWWWCQLKRRMWHINQEPQALRSGGVA